MDSIRQHKLLIYSLKIIPALMAFSYFMNAYCAFVGVGFNIITHYVGMFLAPMLYLYLSSYVFKFCSYHRLFIHYIVVVEALNITDWYIKIPVDDVTICLIHFAITGIFLIIFLIMYCNKYVLNKKSDY
jgi:hypothetical protein